MRFLQRLLVQDRSGATMVEMGFLAALIAVAMIASLHAFSNSLNNTFNVSTKSLLINP